MDYWKICAELVGIFSSILFLYSSACSDDKKLNFFYTIGCLVLSTHLFMLEAYVGGATVMLSALRNILTKNDKSGYIKTVFMLLFLGIFVYYCFNHTYWHEILMPLASLVMSFGFIYLKKNGLSSCIVISCLIWLIYGIQIESYSILFLEISTICSVMVRIIRQNNLMRFVKRKSLKAKV